MSECVPAVLSFAVVDAVPELRATVAIVWVPSLNFTWPVASLGVTVAVRVTVSPACTPVFGATSSEVDESRKCAG